MKNELNSIDFTQLILFSIWLIKLPIHKHIMNQYWISMIYELFRYRHDLPLWRYKKKEATSSNHGSVWPWNKAPTLFGELTNILHSVERVSVRVNLCVCFANMPNASKTSSTWPVYMTSGTLANLRSFIEYPLLVIRNQ